MTEPVAARERRLAERLLEDEALRGDLDDATWQPLQDWLLAAAHRVAATTADLADAPAEAALDAAQTMIRGAVGALVEALGEGTAAPDFAARLLPLHETIRAPLVDAARQSQVHAALRAETARLAASRADAATAAGALVGALDVGQKQPTGHAG